MDNYPLSKLLVREELRWKKGMCRGFLRSKEVEAVQQLVERGFTILELNDNFEWKELDANTARQVFKKEVHPAYTNKVYWPAVWDCLYPVFIRRLVKYKDSLFFVADYIEPNFKLYDLKTLEVIKVNEEEWKTMILIEVDALSE